MKYKTHLVGGLLLGGVTAGAVTSMLGAEIASPEMIFIGGAVAGSLFPDIDHRGSYIGKRMNITSSIISPFLKHRGATHSPIIMGIFTFLLYLLSKAFFPLKIIPLLFSGFYVGILSHILLDMITKGGVPFLYPIINKKISLTNIKTGSSGENIILFLMIIACVFLGFTGIKNENLIARLIGGVIQWRMY